MTDTTTHSAAPTTPHSTPVEWHTADVPTTAGRVAGPRTPASTPMGART